MRLRDRWARFPRVLLVAVVTAATVAGVLAGWSQAASAPVARTADTLGTPVSYSDLQLASMSATRTYGDQISVVGDCTGLAQTFQTAASLSADGNGNGLLTIGTENLGNQAHTITELGNGQLELSYSNPQATSTFEGYGTSFSGTYALTVETQNGPCTTTRPQTLTLQGSGLTLVSPTTTTSTSSSTASSSSSSSTSTTSSTTTSTSTPAGGSVTTAPPSLSYPCSTGLISAPCSVTAITLSGAPFNPVDGYVPQGTAEYKLLLAQGFIPVSGECDEACVIYVQALLSSGQLKLGPRAHGAAAHLALLGKTQLRIHHGAVSARLSFTKTGKRLLREVRAKHFVIEIELWATSPSGKRLGKTKLFNLHVARP